jgi:dethiobiotin synthetase
LVPLNEQGETLADWLATLQLPCVVVAHTGLGTLNHTLLTLEALQRRGIFVAGIVLNGPAHPDNRRSLAAFAKVPIIDSVTWMTPLSATAVARRAQQFDPQNVLAPYFSTT